MQYTYDNFAKFGFKIDPIIYILKNMILIIKYYVYMKTRDLIRHAFINNLDMNVMFNNFISNKLRRKQLSSTLNGFNLTSMYIELLCS